MHGGAAEAVRALRPDPPPDKDPAGGLPAAPVGEPRARRPSRRDVRLPRLHPLLGGVPQGKLGRPAEDRRVASPGARPITRWCRHHRHEPVAEQHAELVRKLHGHYAYYGITGKRAPSGASVHELRDLAQLAEPSLQRERDDLGTFRRLWSGTRCPPAIVHSIYRPQRNRSPRSRMREFRTSGSVGAGGGNSPGHPTVLVWGPGAPGRLDRGGRDVGWSDARVGARRGGARIRSQARHPRAPGSRR